eukprot:Pgem_evm1s19523
MKFTSGVIILFTASAHIQQADAFSWGGLSSLFGEVGNTFVEGAQDLHSALSEVASECKITDIAGCIKNGINAGSDVVIGTKEELDDLADKGFDELVAPLLNPEDAAAAAAAIDNFQNAGTEILEQGQTNALEGVDLGIDITKEALTDLASGSFDLDSTLNKIGDAVEDQVKEDLAELTEDGRVFVDATIDLGQTLGGSVVGNIDHLLQQLVLDGSKALADEFDLTPQLESLIGTVGSGLVGAVGTITDEAAKAIQGGEFDEAALALARDQLFKTLKDLGGDLTTNLHEIALATITNLGDKIDNTISPALVQPVIDNLKATTTQSISALESLMLGENLSTAELEKIKKSIEETVKSFGQSALQHFQQKTAKVTANSKIPLDAKEQKDIAKLSKALESNVVQHKTLQANVVAKHAEIENLRSTSSIKQLEANIKDMWAKEESKYNFISESERKESHDEFAALTAKKYAEKLNKEVHQLNEMSAQIEVSTAEQKLLMDEAKRMKAAHNSISIPTVTPTKSPSNSVQAAPSNSVQADVVPTDKEAALHQSQDKRIIVI